MQMTVEVARCCFSLPSLHCPCTFGRGAWAGFILRVMPRSGREEGCLSATPPFCNGRLLAPSTPAIPLLCIMFAVIVSDGSVEARAYRRVGCFWGEIMTAPSSNAKPHGGSHAAHP